MSKKFLVAFAAAMVMGALAIPAMAQATPYWTVDGNPVTGLTNVKTYSPDLRLTIPAAGLRVDCVAHDHGTIDVGGADEITGITFSNCVATTPLGTCPATTTAVTPVNWATQLFSDPPVIRDAISGIDVVVALDATCPSVYSGLTDEFTPTDDSVNPVIQQQDTPEGGLPCCPDLESTYGAVFNGSDPDQGTLTGVNTGFVGTISGVDYIYVVDENGDCHEVDAEDDA